MPRAADAVRICLRYTLPNDADRHARLPPSALRAGIGFRLLLCRFRDE